MMKGKPGHFTEMFLCTIATPMLRLGLTAYLSGRHCAKAGTAYMGKDSLLRTPYVNLCRSDLQCCFRMTDNNLSSDVEPLYHKFREDSEKYLRFQKKAEEAEDPVAALQLSLTAKQLGVAIQKSCDMAKQLLEEKRNIFNKRFCKMQEKVIRHIEGINTLYWLEDLDPDKLAERSLLPDGIPAFKSESLIHEMQDFVTLSIGL